MLPSKVSRELQCTLVMASRGGLRVEGGGEGAGPERQVFNKVISFPMFLSSLSVFFLPLFGLIGGKVRQVGGGRGGGNPQPFSLSNCCWCGSRIFIITLKSESL